MFLQFCDISLAFGLFDWLRKLTLKRDEFSAQTNVPFIHWDLQCIFFTRNNNSTQLITLAYLV